MKTSLPVLVVDDLRTMTFILCRILRQIGFTDVQHVPDGLSALERLGQKNYGLVISEWEMAPMTGPQLVRAIRQDPALSAIPVILIAAHGTREDEARRIGADDCLSRPFTPKILSDKIEEILSRPSDVIKAVS